MLPPSLVSQQPELKCEQVGGKPTAWPYSAPHMWKAKRALARLAAVYTSFTMLGEQTEMALASTQRIMPVLGDPYVLDAQLEVPGILVQIQHCRWPVLNEAKLKYPRDVLIQTLTPLPPRSMACLTLDDRPGCFDKVGDLVFAPANVPMYSRGGGGPQRCVSLSYDRERLEHVAVRIDRWRRPQFELCLDIRCVPIQHAMSWLAHEALAPGFASPTLVESLGTLVSVQLSRVFAAVCTDLPRPGTLPAWQLRLIEAYIADSTGAPPSVPELAAVCGLSRRHVGRMFKQTTGRTLHEYVEAVRFERAQRLLREQRLSIKEISHVLGFSGVSSFSGAFTRWPASRRGGIGRMPDCWPWSRRHGSTDTDRLRSAAAVQVLARSLNDVPLS